MSAPNSAARKACWEARDKLWQCLDDSGDKAESCQKFQSEFEANCPAQWVNHLFYLSTRSAFSVDRDVREDEMTV